MENKLKSKEETKLPPSSWWTVQKQSRKATHQKPLEKFLYWVRNDVIGYVEKVDCGRVYPQGATNKKGAMIAGEPYLEDAINNALLVEDYIRVFKKLKRLWPSFLFKQKDESKDHTFGQRNNVRLENLIHESGKDSKRYLIDALGFVLCTPFRILWDFYHAFSNYCTMGKQQWNGLIYGEFDDEEENTLKGSRLLFLLLLLFFPLLFLFEALLVIVFYSIRAILALPLFLFSPLIYWSPVSLG